jgi:hypothetical protein
MGTDTVVTTQRTSSKYFEHKSLQSIAVVFESPACNPTRSAGISPGVRDHI